MFNFQLYLKVDQCLIYVCRQAPLDVDAHVQPDPLSVTYLTVSANTEYINLKIYQVHPYMLHIYDKNDI